MQHLEHIESRPAAGARWKRALMGVAAAAFRLHHYRFVRTRMLHDALSGSRDGTGAGDCPR